MSIKSVSRSTTHSTSLPKCSSCGHQTPAASTSPPKAAKQPAVKLKTFAEASKEKAKPIAPRSASAVKNMPADVVCTPRPANIGGALQGVLRCASVNAYQPLGSVRFGNPTPTSSHQLSPQDLIHAQNARLIAATNPVINSPQALAGPVHPGRGPANLSAVSAPNVRLPEMGRSPEIWAALNGITISWEDNNGMSGAALPDNRHIVLSKQLLNMPQSVRWYAMFHEIGHVLAGHSQRQPRPSPVRFEWEHDADLYARQAVTVTDPQQDLANKTVIASWLRTLPADSEHEAGSKIAEWLLQTVKMTLNQCPLGAFAMAA